MQRANLVIEQAQQKNVRLTSGLNWLIVLAIV